MPPTSSHESMNQNVVTAYERPTDYLADLVRELQAWISETRRHSDLTQGKSHRTDNRTVPLHLDADQIVVLARGGSIRVPLAAGQEPSTLTIAILASDGELETEQWRDLGIAARAWRLARTQATPVPHPAHAYHALESQLDERDRFVAGFLLCHHVPGLLNRILSRCNFHITNHPEVGDVLELFISDPIECIMAAERFIPGGSLQRFGIVAATSEAELRVPLIRRDVIPSQMFLDECLGLGLSRVTFMPGVMVLQPTTRLHEVVLAPAIAEQVRQLDLPTLVDRPRDHALGILLHGPSGTGKTMLAMAMAATAGRPLLTLDAHALSKEQPGEIVSSLLRRAASERALLFIDEVDTIARAGSDASRALLIGLESRASVVILATNNPLALDPAMDRRLQVKLHLDLPGPSERFTILQRELVSQQVVLAEGDTQEVQDRLRRLTRLTRLSGGYWRNVVQMAAMRAGLRQDRTVTGDDLARAARTQACSILRSQWESLAWDPDETPDAGGAELVSQEKSVRLGAIGRQLYREGDRVSAPGGILIITGPDFHLAAAYARHLGRSLDLPMVQMGTRSVLPASESAGVDADCRRFLTSEREGEAALVFATLPAKQHDAWLEVLTRAAASPHLLVIHLPDGAPPAWLRDLACGVLPWAELDAAEGSRLWSAWGGPGIAPDVRTVACLKARLRGLSVHDLVPPPPPSRLP